MADIYAQFDAATRNLEAYAILKDGDMVGRVVFRHGNQCTCFAQLWGLSMARGWARGYGYDKASAAFEAAASRIHATDLVTPLPRDLTHLEAWHRAVKGQEGDNWRRRLEAEGYTVIGVL